MVIGILACEVEGCAVLAAGLVGVCAILKQFVDDIEVAAR
jgi:hypothetical protein